MITKENISCVSTGIPGPRSAELLARWKNNEADLTGNQAPVVWDHANGSVVTDVDGNRFLDWTSGVLVTNVGHCHPDLVAAMQKASSRLLNNYECANLERIHASEDLVRALPDHMDRCFFLSTGSEAVEAAARLMKRKTGKFEILGFNYGFHGRTSHAAAMGGMASMKKGYGPSVPGIIRAPYPNPYRDPCGWCSDGPDFDRYFEFLDELIYSNSSGSLAGLIVEPYQGAGGFIFPPTGWLKRLEEWARSKDMLFTIDEVQASFGRTGTMWAHEHEGLTPDLMTLGKGIGCGCTASAIVGRKEVFDCLSKGELSSTYGGNPVSSAAVSAVLEIMSKENLVEAARTKGAYLKDRLEELARSVGCMGDVRGRGLVMGIELVKNGSEKEPAPELIPQLIQACAEKGLLIGAVGYKGNVVRVAPPLTISTDELDESIQIMSFAIREIDNRQD